MPNFIIIFLFSCFFCTSQVLNNNLVVFSENGSPFVLYVNGEKINNEPEADVKVFNISEGWCKLKAKFEKDNIIVSDSIDIKTFEKNNNKEITYAIKQGTKTNKFVFVSIGDLSGPKIPLVAKKPIVTGPVIDNNLYGNLYRAKENKPMFFYNYNDTTGKCRIDLDSLDIKYALNLINKSNDIHDKAKYVEVIIERNCYIVNQLLQLLITLETEMEKFKMVKKAYPHIIDKINTKKLDVVFTFKSMKEEYEYFLEETANIEHQLSLKCTVAVSDNKVSEIIKTIKRENYEHDKLRVAKEQMVNNCVNTSQVKTILNIFNHDRERMDFVRSAYNVTIDKENFKILEDEFQFIENKKEFLTFISK
ncbi:MAG TPA: DUF4476 domain-containing protein [Bacteroidia bacterium]|jgi:hypothetical protein|nr:DUF4476 domain-containing protein [Bacteroidia bacterium]